MAKGNILVIALLCGAFALAAAGEQEPSGSAHPQRTEEERRALINRTVDNQQRDDALLDIYERIERVEKRKRAGDSDPIEINVYRAVPAGTGTDRIPLGPDAKPTDEAAYRRELEKLAHSLEWAAQSGRAQRDAYQKVAKKRRERNELIDATRTAFVYTWVADEPRGDRLLSKFRMEPNPGYRPTSRATSILTKVSGYLWIDEAEGELARVDCVTTDDISIGGFLAKVYKGSHFMQERYAIAPGVWLPSFSQYDFDGRKFFSSMAVHERTFYSHYRRIGPPKEALALIRAELSKAAGADADP